MAEDKKSRLGDLEFTVVTTQNLSLPNSVSDKPVEDGYDISDHISHEPLSFTIDVTVTGENIKSKRQKLIEMRNSSNTFEYFDAKNLVTYSDLAIESIELPDNVSVANGFEASISLKQIKIARREDAEIRVGESQSTGEQVEKDSSDKDKRDIESETVDEETMPDHTRDNLVP